MSFTPEKWGGLGSTGFFTNSSCCCVRAGLQICVIILKKIYLKVGKLCLKGENSVFGLAQATVPGARIVLNMREKLATKKQ